jgi:tetratricopeptide (TPR) repeat protein
MTNKFVSYRKSSFAFAFLIILVFLIYSNTFRASWHMDDYHNITHNTQIHIKDLHPLSLFNAFFFYDGPNKKLSRPISSLTFAINWYFCKMNVFGYHVVNILIHFLIAYFLFLSVYNILKLPRLRDRYGGREYSIALLTSTFWAIHPIQTQAVTYIVQRMASLSTMFYILAILLYIKARMTNLFSKRALLFFCCLISFLMALGSKENAAILPISLIFLEVCFFQDLGRPRTRKAFFWAFLFGSLLILAFGTLFFSGNPLSFLTAFDDRPFTIWQRLLTEPRVLVFYLTQIFYPVPTRLSIEHDIAVSTSLFNPWATLPCIVIVLLLIALGLSQIKKRPVLAFGILFYFLNHVIESSVLGLELIFEHRNYLPSLFFFFPVATGVLWILDYYKEKKRSMYYMLISFITLMLIGLGMGTYIRNMAWATEKTLWEDAMAKAPMSARPPHNLAWGYYEVLGRYDKAMEMYAKSFSLEWHSISHRANALYGMGGIHFKKREYGRAVELYRKALKFSPKDEMTYQQMALSLMKLGKWDEALKNTETLLLWRPEEAKYLNQKSFILVKQKRPEEAILYLKKCLKLNPANLNALINIGAALNLIGAYERAEFYLKAANSLNPKGILSLLWLIETNLKIGDSEDVDRYIDKVFGLVVVSGFTSVVKILSDHTLMVPVSEEAIIRKIAVKLDEKAEEIAKLEAYVSR